MGNTPFILSFDEVKEQADANMQADRAGSVPAAGSTPTVEQTEPKKQKSFLDMVTSAQKDLAMESGAQASKQETAPASETPAAPAAQSDAPAAQPDVPQTDAASVFELPTTGANTAGQPLSFDELLARAAGGAGQTSVIDNLFTETQEQTQAESTPAQTDTPEPAADVKTAAAEVSFDELFAGAGTSEIPGMNSPAAQPVNTAVAESVQPENTAAAEPEKTEGSVQPEESIQPENTTAAEIAQPENTAAAEPEKTEESVQPENTAATETVQPENTAATEPEKTEESVQPENTAATEPEKTEKSVQPEKAEKKPGKTRKKTAKKTAGEETKEPLPDMTDSYRVDLPGKTSTEVPDDRKGMYPASMESLFTKEELEELRADIRTFMRREIRTAMVGAMKDLLKETGE